MRLAYLALLLVSVVGVVALDRRFGAGVTRRASLPRLARAAGTVLVVFLAFDLVGVVRGWFATEPARVVLLLPPGIPLEEPILLAFLALLSVAMYAAFRGERRA